MPRSSALKSLLSTVGHRTGFRVLVQVHKAVLGARRGVTVEAPFRQSLPTSAFCAVLGAVVVRAGVARQQVAVDVGGRVARRARIHRAVPSGNETPNAGRAAFGTGQRTPCCCPWLQTVTT